MQQIDIAEAGAITSMAVQLTLTASDAFPVQSACISSQSCVFCFGSTIVMEL